MSTVTMDLPANANIITPISEDIGGTGVSNALGRTITLGGPLVTTGTVTIAGNTTITAPLSGIVVPTVAAVSGCSSPSLVPPSMISAVSTAVGGVVDLLVNFSLTATDTTAVFNITVPTSTTANFADTAQARGIGVVTSGTSGGSLVSIVSVAASKNVQVTLTLGSNSDTYTGVVAISYFVN